MQVSTTNAKRGSPPFKRKTGDEVHASGTIIHWDVRAPADQYGTIGITCHQCKLDSYIPKASIKNPSWHGLCSVCIATGKLPRKLKGKEKLKLGGEVDWDDVDPGNLRRRRVACPNVAECGNKEFKRIDAGNKNRQPFYCRPCFLEYRRSRMTEAWGARSRTVDADQKKGPRGRKRGDQILNRETAKRDFENIVAKLSRTLPEREITRRAITAEFHRKGESLDESAVTKRVQLLYGKDFSVASAVAEIIGR